MATKMNFVCDEEILGSHAVMCLMAGQTLGCVLGGVAADRVGRKSLFYIAILVHFATSVCTTWVNSFILLAVVFFINGFSISTAYCSCFTLALELVGPKLRPLTGIGVTAFWSVGMLWVCLLAFFLRDSTQLQLAASIPAAIFVFYVCLIRESPRWLVDKGRYSEAEDILERMARMNGRQLTTRMNLDMDFPEDYEARALSPLILFRYPKLLLRAGIVWFNWFVCSLTYYGLSLNVGELFGSIFLNFCMSAVVELAAYILILIFVAKVGRKFLYCSALLIGGFGCLLTLVPAAIGGSWENWMVRVLAWTGKCGVSGAFAIMWLFTPEMFPTQLRAGVTGASSCAARIGGVVASYIANLTVTGIVGHLMPQVIFGCLALLAGTLALTLPETSQTKLPDSVEDAIDMSVMRPRSGATGNKSQSQPMI